MEIKTEIQVSKKNFTHLYIKIKLKKKFYLLKKKIIIIIR